jgi:hypothetical protein
VGNHSRNHLDLIFEEDESEYTDIFVCGQFGPEEPDLDLRGMPILSIMRDEEANFQPSIDETIRMQKFQNAYDEIVKPTGYILPKKDYERWLAKHRELHDDCDPFGDAYYSITSMFVRLYSRIKRLESYGNHSEQAQMALDEFFLMPSGDDRGQDAWLEKYCDLYECIPFLFGKKGDNFSDLKPGWLEKLDGYDILIDVSEFASEVYFYRVYLNAMEWDWV